VHKVEIDVVDAERLEGAGNSLLYTLVPGVVELGCDPDLFAGDTGGADALADFGFVTVYEGATGS